MYFSSFKTYCILGFALFLITSCSKQTYSHTACLIDAKVVKENGKINLVGPSVFQLPDSFFWCGTPIRIKDKYLLLVPLVRWEGRPMAVRSMCRFHSKELNLRNKSDELIEIV